jgi:hypothetical protein
MEEASEFRCRFNRKRYPIVRAAGSLRRRRQQPKAVSKHRAYRQCGRGWGTEVECKVNRKRYAHGECLWLAAQAAPVAKGSVKA